MAHVLELFQNLSKFFSPYLTRDQVEDFFETAQNKQEAKQPEKSAGVTSQEDASDESDDDSEDSGGFSSSSESSDEGNDEDGAITCFEDIPIVRLVCQNSQATSILLEIACGIRDLRASKGGYDNTYDCWDRVITVAPRDQYLTFIYTLLRLAAAEPSSKIYRKLTLASAQAYILSLTIPGAKGFHIFDDKMIEQAIEVFRLLDAIKEPGIAGRISDTDQTELWVNLATFCDDLKIMFRYVHFEEFNDIRNAIIWELNKLLFNNHLHGYVNTYAAILHSKCFEIYEEIANAHNGDPEDTLMKMMKITYCLHVFPPKPKRPKFSSASIDSSQFIEHISDWFINIISKSPRVVTKILKHFIEFVVTSQTKADKDEKIRLLDYAAKYDAAMYTKCNESNLDFLLKASRADDIYVRTNAVELLTRIILIESKVNWEMFRHEISSIPREVYAIKELLNRMLDSNNSVKLKTINGVQQAFIKGTPDASKILTEGIKFAIFDDTGVVLPEEPRIRFREIRYEPPMPVDPNYTFEGRELLTEEFSKLPNTIYYLTKNNTAHVRRGALCLLETIVVKNPHIIYRTKFVQETSKLGEDGSIEVRKQALQMIDSILNHYPNCYPVIYVWSQIIVPLFKDSDAKIVDQAWECFRKRVFENIRGIDSSNQAEHFMPWVILRVLLSTQHRHFLQSCILDSINKKILNHKVLTIIESHTLTSNSTEAWIMLSFIAGKMKCKDGDSLISSFIKSTLEQSWNAGQKLQIMLEVLTIWINEFSHTALNMAFSCIINLIKNGTIPANIISKALNFCASIAAKSEDNKNLTSKGPAQSSRRKSKSQLKWMKDIHTTAENYLVENLTRFQENRAKLMSFLFAYSEVNLELYIRPNPDVIRFLHKYLQEYIDTPNIHPEDVTFLNQIIILAGRFSIRDTNVASITCLLYRLILKKTERPTTVSNIIVCITDLCKKHTQIVELALAEIITKLRSPYVEIRLITFKNLAQMVLQDLIKLRGNLLLSLMAVLLDKNRELSNRATEFFFTYLERKNAILFQTCLLECPFVYNGYMDFEGFESFSPAEMQIDSPLKGDENESLRQLLYKAFMSEQEETILLMFFENLKLIYAKVLKEPSVNSKAGHSMIKDMLFIMKEICYQTYPKSSSSQAASEEQNEQDADDGQMPVSGTLSASNSKDAQSKETTKKKKNIPTMTQALSMIEKMICLIPKIADHVIKWNDSFLPPLNDLAVAVCCRFENFIEFAQPQSFWAPHKKKAKTVTTPSKKRKLTIATKVNETDSEPEGDNEDEKRPKLDENVQHSTSDKPISMLFKPLLL